MSAIEARDVVGVLLAGGLARRMGGGDKCLRALRGRTVLDLIVVRVRPQVGRILLNANGDPSRFRSYGLPIAGDVVEDHPGPLAGVLTGMEWAAANAPDCGWIATFATDAPFLPADLVPRLAEALVGADADLACARSGGRAHPVFGLWPVRLRGDLRRAVMDEGVRKVDEWTGRYALVEVDFAVGGIDPFFNLNRPADFEAAARHMARMDGDG